MAFCPKCGTQVPDDSQFCPACGAQVGAAEQAAQPEKKDEALPVFEEEELTSGQPWSILAYIALAVLFPIFMAKNNKYARYNSNQGLLLLIAGAIGSVITPIPIVGWICGPAIESVVLVFAVLQVIAVCKKQVRRVPLIGKIQILK